MTITASQAGKDLHSLIKKVNDERVPVRGASVQGNAVLMSEDDYEAWQETVFLLRSPRNAGRLMRSISQMDNGGGAVHAFIDVEGAE
ncbi:type II toxin-antitoxin system Phd/YefM family antitoxin [Salininema proteolyticum]|uniref:Antitoxin n=1 Tax=Salininema proteolyticum TaxID=1607685 RepID=A0ABV8U138_9ACTN